MPRAIRSVRAGTAQWQEATGGRYLDLALSDESHFAQSNARLVPPGGAGRTDHRTKFTEGHARALWESELGNSQARNSLSGHFLTDAFSAGKVVTKADVMSRFTSRLTERTDFLDAVAAGAWQDDGVRRRMSIRGMAGLPHAKAVHDAVNSLQNAQ